MSDYDINKMDFKQLRNEVQLLRDELAIFKRKYEDIIYNLDNDNFSSQLIKEKEGMKTSIEVNAEGIKTKVSNEDFESEKTQTASKIESAVKTIDEQLSSKITQTANEIYAEVSTNYDNLNNQISSVSVTANSVKSTVSSVFSTITKVDSKSAMTDTSKIYTYNGANWHYNRISNSWVQIAGNSIASSFLQTVDGFELSGDVSISGNAIVGGAITGASLKNSTGTHKLVMSVDNDAEYGTFRLYNDHYGTIPYFSVYDNTLGSISLKASGVGFLGATVSGGVTVEPYGTWDFSECTDVILPDGVGGGIAKFA